MLITNVQFTPALRDFCWEIEEMNRASVSTASQRDETKWQNTCTAEYLNGCQLLVTLGKEKKALNMFYVAFPHACETSSSAGSTQEPGAETRVGQGLFVGLSSLSHQLKSRAVLM